MRFQHLAARLAFAGFLLAALIAAAAVAGTRLGGWPYALGCRVMIPGVAAAGFGALLGAVWIVTALRRNISTGFRLGMIGLIGSVLILIPPVTHFWRLRTLPPLHTRCSRGRGSCGARSSGTSLLGPSPKFQSKPAWFGISFRMQRNDPLRQSPGPKRERPGCPGLSENAALRRIRPAAASCAGTA